MRLEIVCKLSEQYAADACHAWQQTHPLAFLCNGIEIGAGRGLLVTRGILRLHLLRADLSILTNQVQYTQALSIRIFVCFLDKSLSFCVMRIDSYLSSHDGLLSQTWAETTSLVTTHF